MMFSTTMKIETESEKRDSCARAGSAPRRLYKITVQTFSSPTGEKMLLLDDRFDEAIAILEDAEGS